MLIVVYFSSSSSSSSDGVVINTGEEKEEKDEFKYKVSNHIASICVRKSYRAETREDLFYPHLVRRLHPETNLQKKHILF